MRYCESTGTQRHRCEQRSPARTDACKRSGSVSHQQEEVDVVQAEALKAAGELVADAVVAALLGVAHVAVRPQNCAGSHGSRSAADSSSRVVSGGWGGAGWGCQRTSTICMDLASLPASRSRCLPAGPARTGQPLPVARQLILRLRSVPVHEKKLKLQ